MKNARLEFVIVTNAPADDTSLHPRRARRRLHNQRSSTVTLHNYFSIKFQFQVAFWNGKLQSYTARVFAWISGTEETVDDSTWSIAAVLLLAFRIRDHLNSDLLQNRWLTAAYNSINQDEIIINLIKRIKLCQRPSLSAPQPITAASLPVY